MNSLALLKQPPDSIFFFLRHISANANRNSRALVRKTTKVPSAKNGNFLKELDAEASQIQASFRQTKVNPRDEFGNLSRMRMPQTEAVQKGFQPDIWDQSYEIIRVAKEREKTFREKLEDEFAEGRVKQVSKPLFVTIRHALKKAQKLTKWRETRAMAIRTNSPIPLPPKIADGILTAKLRKAREAIENGPQLELVKRRRRKERTTTLIK